MKNAAVVLTIFGMLVGCSSPESTTTAGSIQTYTILGSEKIQARTSHGLPIAAEDDFTKIEAAGMMLGPSEKDPKLPCIGWALGIRSKTGEKPLSLLVEDVTGLEAVPIFHEDSPNLDSRGLCNRYTGFLEPMSLKSTPWLYEPGQTVKIFRFTVSYPSGHKSVLFQPSVVNELTKAAAAKVGENIRKG